MNSEGEWEVVVNSSQLPVCVIAVEHKKGAYVFNQHLKWYIWNNKTKDKNHITATVKARHKHLIMIKQCLILKTVPLYSTSKQMYVPRSDITLPILWKEREPFCVREEMELSLCLMFMYNTHQRIVCF